MASETVKSITMSVKQKPEKHAQRQIVLPRSRRRKVSVQSVKQRRPRFRQRVLQRLRQWSARQKLMRSTIRPL